MQLTAEEVREQVKLVVGYKNDLALSKMIAKPSFPIDYLDKIAWFSPVTWKYSRSAARRHPQLPVLDIERCLREWFDLPRTKADVDILRNPSITSEMIVTLLQGLSEDNRIRASIYILPYSYCPDSVIESAVTINNYRTISPIRVAAAHSPKLSHPQIKELLNNGTIVAQKALVSNPHVSLKYLRELLWSPKDPLSEEASIATLPVVVAQALIRRLPEGPDREYALGWLRVNSHSKHSRRLVAKYTNDPAKVEESCLDPAREVRETAARHKLASEEGQVAVVLLGLPVSNQLLMSSGSGKIQV